MAVHMSKDRSSKIRINSHSLYLWTSVYDPMFVERMKLFSLRKYDPKTKKWELPLHSMAQILKSFTGIVIVGEIEEHQREKFESIERYLEYLDTLELKVDFNPKTKPDKHQIEWFNEMLDRNRVLLGDPMGLGKTKQYLDVCEYRRVASNYQNILFICKSKHKWNMAKEIETHTNSRYLVVDGTRERRLQTLRDFYADDDIYYLVIGYEMACTHMAELKILGREIIFDGVLMDEFNKIKNWETGGRKRKDKKPHLTVQITDLVETLNPELLILGSGTPITKRPTDLYAPMRLVGVEKSSYYTFKNQYCTLDYFGTVLGTKNEAELSDKLWSVMIRRPKELLRLPEPRISYIPVEMSSEQRKLYNACLMEIKKELVGTKAYGASQLAKLTRLRQITTSPFLVDSDAPSIKEELLREYVDEIVASGEKAIIYSVYRTETQRLLELFKEYNPAYVDGTVKAKEAQEEVDRFQSDPETKLFIGSLFSCMESYTLTAASHEFFLDLSWTVSDNKQAQARAHRRGQDKVVNIWIFYCVKSIDERVLEIHAEDQRLISEVVEGTTYEGTRDLIDRLLS